MTGAALPPSEAGAQEFQAVEGEEIVFRIPKPNIIGLNRSPTWAVRYSILTEGATGVSVAGKATVGEDYRVRGRKLVFGPARKFANLKVATLTDDIEEGRETFNIYLSDPEWVTEYRRGEGNQKQAVWTRTNKLPQSIVRTGAIIDR